VLLFILAVGSINLILHDGRVTIAEAIGLVSLYVAYVIIVAVGHMMYKSDWFQRNDPLRPKADIHHTVHESAALLPKHYYANLAYSELPKDYGFEQDIDGPLARDQSQSLATPFWEAATPFDPNEWEAAGVVGKALQVLRAPLLFVLRWTTPVIVAADSLRWCRSLFALQCLVSPVVVMFLTDSRWHEPGSIPDYGVMLIVGAVVAIAVLLLSPGDRPPSGYAWLSLVGPALGARHCVWGERRPDRTAGPRARQLGRRPRRQRRRRPVRAPHDGSERMLWRSGAQHADWHWRIVRCPCPSSIRPLAAGGATQPRGCSRDGATPPAAWDVLAPRHSLTNHGHCCRRAGTCTSRWRGRPR
jgi:hypothetical protein